MIEFDCFGRDNISFSGSFGGCNAILIKQFLNGEYYTGYVSVPKTSPAYGMSYSQLSKMTDFKDITFAESCETDKWIIGFDTAGKNIDQIYAVETLLNLRDTLASLEYKKIFSQSLENTLEW